MDADAAAATGDADTVSAATTDTAAADAADTASADIAADAADAADAAADASGGGGGGGAAGAPRGAWAAHGEIASLVETALLGYDIPPLMVSDDVVKELLKLMKLDGYAIPSSFGPRAWLEAAVVASRARAAAAAATAGGNASSPRAGAAPGSLLLPQLGSVTAAELLGGTANAVSDDHFALLTMAVMQAVGATSRLVVCCERAGEGSEAREGGS